MPSPLACRWGHAGVWRRQGGPPACVPQGKGGRYRGRGWVGPHVDPVKPPPGMVSLCMFKQARQAGAGLLPEPGAVQSPMPHLAQCPTPCRSTAAPHTNPPHHIMAPGGGRARRRLPHPRECDPRGQRQAAVERRPAVGEGGWAVVGAQAHKGGWVEVVGATAGASTNLLQHHPNTTRPASSTQSTLLHGLHCTAHPIALPCTPPLPPSTHPDAPPSSPHHAQQPIPQVRVAALPVPV